MCAAGTPGPEDLESAQFAEVLRRRAESLAQEQEEESQGDTLGLLLFRLAEEWYAFPVEGVREIHNEYKVTRIPRVPEHILGVINVRGEILSVMDLATLIGVPSRTVRDIGAELPSAIIVANEKCVSAVVVDEIGDIAEVQGDAVEPSLSTLDRARAEFIGGSVYLDNRLVGIVNLEKVLEPIGDTA